MLSTFATRHSRRRLVLEFNPHQVLAAEISHVQRGKVVVEAMAEFPREDSSGLTSWIEDRTWTRVICGLVPRRGIVQRESLHAQRLAEPDYLANAVEEQQKGQFLSATPFKVVKPEDWTLRAVDAISGKRLTGEGAAHPAVICGIVNDEVQDIQHRLLDERLIPERIESGLLSLFGAMFRNGERRGDLRAVAVVVVHQMASAVYILGKEGVHTPTPILHGLGSIEDIARKEFGVKSDAEALRMLHSGDPQVLARAERLVRRIGRDLKPVLDSYEMTTGQPLDEIYCAYLPPSLGWLAEALAKATGRVPTSVDCADWMPGAGVQLAEGLPVPGPHWLGALSLVANLPEPVRLKSKRASDELHYHRPWHVDYKLSGMSAERLAASRRFLAGIVAAALLVFAGAMASWQLYANRTLRQDLDYWQSQMAANRGLFDQLTASNTRLQAQSAALKQAYDLMASPYQLSEFIISVGRTIPPRMRVDVIETNDVRAAISGVLFEPAEEATGTLGAYMEGLRRNPAIGPLFSSIAITSLQRKGEGDAVLFEITLRLKEPSA